MLLKYNYLIEISSYEKSKIYDIIIGGIIYSKQLETFFHDYDVIKYFEDSIIVLCLSKNNFNLETFKSSKDEDIGLLMYSYSYYLLKQYFPKARIYAYEEDLLNDLIESKVKYIVIDKSFFLIPKIYQDKIKNIGEIYKEELCLFINKSKKELKERIIKIIDNLDFKEILKWLK